MQHLDAGAVVGHGDAGAVADLSSRVGAQRFAAYRQHMGYRLRTALIVLYYCRPSSKQHDGRTTTCQWCRLLVKKLPASHRSGPWGSH